MRYWKVLAWTAVGVVLLTVGQYGCVHLLTGRPSSWLFETSLDFGPPLLFFGDMVQLTFTGDAQAPLRDQPVALAAGMAANKSSIDFAPISRNITSRSDCDLGR